MKKYIYIVLFTLLLIILVSSIKVEANNQQKINENKDIVQQTNDDINVIPDKYNTGIDKNIKLTKVNPGDTYQGIHFKTSGSGENIKNVIDFYYDNVNSKIEDERVVIENADFSEHSLVFYNSDKAQHNIHIVFNNCKFSGVSVGMHLTKLTFEFNNCTMVSLNGSNIVANNCYFGGAACDAIVPFQNVKINNCYITDRSYSNPSGVHIDGTQIYGNKDVEAKNIHFNNCRFEIPVLYINEKENTSYINACIMLQIEYNNGSDITFDNCIINGGGYSVYAESKFPDTYEITDSAITNLRIGSSRKWGAIYSRKSEGVKFENVTDTDSLYVSSVWKDKDGQHIIVTNDTGVERELTVYTDKGDFVFKIPKMLSSTEIEEQKISNLSQLPIDIEKIIEEDCNWMVFCDTTQKSYPKQIRYINYSSEQVLESETIYKDTPYMDYNEVIISEGKCGENVTYKLKGDGTIILSGEGATYNYHSGSLPPWYQYKNKITKVVVEEGITILGNQLFNKMEYLQEVTLPISLNKIGNYSIRSALLEKIYYTGTQQQWDLIEINENNSIEEEKVIKKINVTGIQTDKSQITLKIGEKQTLKVSVLPVNATNKEINLKSLNENIVTITNNNIITGISEGTTQIIASVENGEHIVSNITVIKNEKQEEPKEPEQIEQEEPKEPEKIEQEEIKKTEETQQEEIQRPQNPEENKQEDQNIDNDIKLPETEDQTIANTPIPQTGEIKWLKYCIIIMIIVSFISFIKYKKYQV